MASDYFTAAPCGCHAMTTQAGEGPSIYEPCDAHAGAGRLHDFIQSVLFGELLRIRKSATPQ